jgi:putative hydrolase of the HAD superfamily
MSHTIKAVFFDLGNVVIDFDHLIAVEKITAHSGTAKQDIFQLIFDSGLTELFEEGKIAPEVFFTRLKDTLALTLDYERFVPIWNEIFFVTQRNRFVHDAIRQLRGHVPVFLLSNVNELHFRYIEERFRVSQLFDKLILSYEVGARKPSAAIYRAAVLAAGCAPQEIAYFDDRADLITAARALGLHGLQFSGAEQLQDDLTRLALVKPSREASL